ncbi:hypothetical protein DFH06DRAFT_684769 [Mycena polygramma]|nr:hypothetical protein DFH06DRAFT_684769 [Mycena polygramma]
MSYPPFYNYAAQQVYQQPAMGQAGPNGYMPIYAAPNPYAPATPYGLTQSTPHPAQVPFIPPTAMLETPPVQPQPLQSKHRPKHSHRAATTPLPLKSALKKTGTAAIVPGAPAPLAEGSHPRRRTASRTKPDAHTAVAPIEQALAPSVGENFHMFVTFKGDSEMLLENTLDHARREIETEIFPIWPYGVETQVRGYDWIVRFRNAPWNMNGPDVAVAWKLIVELFSLFSRRGFTFMTTTKCTTAQPRLIFQSTRPDKDSIFFLAYLSRGGRRISLINPPPRVALAFAPTLNLYLSNQVEVSQDQDMIIAETKRELGSAAIKPAGFLMQILRVLMEQHFNLNATLPMARGGPLGMGPRRELLVFKGFPPEKLSH